MSIVELIRQEMKPFEVKALVDVILKESNMLGARAQAIENLAKGEKDPLKLVEYCAEVIMIRKIINSLEELTEETISEAEKLGMTKE